MNHLNVFPDDVVVRQLPLGAAAAWPLFAVEKESIKCAALRRQREFAAGRASARLALLELGVAPCSIPVGGGGRPIWPPGFVGSITHEGELACSAVAFNDAYASIGIDLTAVGSVSDELATLICADGESERLSKLPPTVDHLGLLFSAKESVYKCFYPLERVFLDFVDVIIIWDCAGGDSRGAYCAAFTDNDVAWGRSQPIIGRWSVIDGQILTGAYYRRQFQVLDRREQCGVASSPIS